MSWRIATRHRSAYRYTAPVVASYNEARILPTSSARQRVIEAFLTVAPETPLYTYRDYWSTLVVAFDVEQTHEELVITGNSVVDTVAAPPRSNVGWEELEGPGIVDELVEYLEPTSYTRADAELAMIAARFRQEAATPGDAVEAIARWIVSTLEYRAGTTEVSTSAIEAWHQRSGVCQDFAHVSLALLRMAQIPARYVSGFHYAKENAQVGETVPGAGHAWVEAWLGEWYPFDPTIGEPVGERHVTVARGRDYADVAPFRGVYHGGKLDRLEVTVELTRLA